MNLRNLLSRRQIVIWVPEPEPEPRVTGSGSGRGSESSAPVPVPPRPDPFETAPKAPAGKPDPRPEFNIYLGVNTGPYNTTENGTLILPPIPIEWIVAPRPLNSSSSSASSNHSSTSVLLPNQVQCPTRSENLRLFGITNIIVALLILITACRPLIRILTGGILGSPGKWSKYWTWMISFALTVGSNALVSKLIVTTAGYEHLSMVNVFALYSSRPRINQIFTGLLRIIVGPVFLKGRGRVVTRKRRLKATVEEVEMGHARGKGSSGTGMGNGTGPGVSTGTWGGRGTGTGMGGSTYYPAVAASTSSGAEASLGINPAVKIGNTGYMYVKRGYYNEWKLERDPGPWGGLRGGGKERVKESTTTADDDDEEERGKWCNLRKRWNQWRCRANRYEYYDDLSTEEEWIYTDSYVATSIAELFIQLVSAIFIGITWRRFPNDPIRDHMKNYYNYMLAAPALSLAGWVLIPIWWKRTRGVVEGNRERAALGCLCIPYIIWFLGFTGFFTYGVAWRYWAELLTLPGSLWCPPKFVEQAAVWSSFSALAAFSGAIF